MRLAFQGRSFAGRTAGARAPIEPIRPPEPVRLPLSRARRSRRVLRRLWIAALASMCLAGALAFMSAARNSGAPGMGAAAIPPAPLPAWIEISHPAALFRLEAPELGPELGKAPPIHEARRHRTGGGRQDILVLGALNGPGPFLRLMIYRVGSEAAPEAAFFVDLARRAAEIGRAIARAAQPAALPTRFGLVEVADMALTRSDGSAAACLGFRGAGMAGRPRVTGFACDASDASVPEFTSRSALACLLERIDLAPAADDKELAALFAARESNGDAACAARGRGKARM